MLSSPCILRRPIRALYQGDHKLPIAAHRCLAEVRQSRCGSNRDPCLALLRRDPILMANLGYRSRGPGQGCMDVCMKFLVGRSIRWLLPMFSRSYQVCVQVVAARECGVVFDEEIVSVKEMLSSSNEKMRYPCLTLEGTTSSLDSIVAAQGLPSSRAILYVHFKKCKETCPEPKGIT